jgi:hypothetical protein
MACTAASYVLLNEFLMVYFIGLDARLCRFAGVSAVDLAIQTPTVLHFDSQEYHNLQVKHEDINIRATRLYL